MGLESVIIILDVLWSLCVCASPRARTLIRVRNSSLAQDGGEVLVMCVVGFAREVASRVLLKYSLEVSFSH